MMSKNMMKISVMVHGPTTFGCRKEDTFTEASACQDGHLMMILKEFHEILAHLSGYVEVWSEVLACFSFCTETHTMTTCTAH